MPDTYHIDFETYSAADLRKVGEHRYAEDGSTEILLCAISVNDGPVVLWDRYASYDENEPARECIYKALAYDAFARDHSDALLYAHNANFEAAISRVLWSDTFNIKPPDLSQWRCTQAMCRRVAIPSSLEKAAEFLGLSEQKDKRGKALIQLFSVKPKTGRLRGLRVNPIDHYAEVVTIAGEKMTVAAAWKLFGDYCRQDVRTEQAIHRKLKAAEFEGDILDGFLFDLRMNHRGIPVDVESMKRAHQMVTVYAEKLTQECMELSGLVPAQTGAMLAWLQERGYTGTNLQADNLDAAIEESEDEETEDESMWTPEATPEARRVLHIRRLLSSASVKKLPTMIASVCSDGRLRGQISFWGASRTGRSSGKGSQPQNFKRPTVEAHEDAFDDLRNGMSADHLELLYGDLLDVISSCVRHFIRDDGRLMLDSDFAQIEARVLAWMAGHNKLMAAFRRGDDLYKITYAATFGGRYEDVTKEQRFIGKVIALFLGYLGGENAFVTGAKTYGVEVESKKAREIVAAYRENNPEMPRLWRAIGDAVKDAIRNPGEVFRVPTCNVTYVVRRFAGYDNLIATLPSGRSLIYPKPEIHRVVKKFEDKDTGVIKDWEVDEISYWGQKKNVWCRVRSHAGVFCENLAQAIAGDFLTAGVVRADKAGYNIFMLVHDQALAHYEPEKGQTPEEFTKLMCELPSWAPDFPLAAATNVVRHYSKD